MLRHSGICNYLTDHPVNRHVHALVTDAHAFLSVTTVSFDMSLKEIGTTLFNGLTLVFADENQANNPILLTALFERTHADAFNATPSRMLQYMELPAFCEALSGCKVVMCGGEKYPDGLLDRLRRITGARIFNTYGPTEITVSSNAKELTHATEISIGRPLLNYLEYIVDSDGNERPAGVVGELYIGGTGVALGYNNLEEMTRERFIEYNGGRVYKSGDYARWTPEGDVVVLGRTDNQVKLRGLRIELGEIEASIVKTEGIRNAVVMIRKIHGGEHLCAYFTADRQIDIADLKDELKTTLAPYMVPTAYLQMESMPLTPNGKTDLKALPEPQLFLAGRGEAAANEVEARFCQIFADILGLNEVGATDSFFDLGGTSLADCPYHHRSQQIRVRSRLRGCILPSFPQSPCLDVPHSGTAERIGSGDRELRLRLPAAYPGCQYPGQFPQRGASASRRHPPDRCHRFPRDTPAERVPGYPVRQGLLPDEEQGLTSRRRCA